MSLPAAKPKTAKKPEAKPKLKWREVRSAPSTPPPSAPSGFAQRHRIGRVSVT